MARMRWRRTHGLLAAVVLLGVAFAAFAMRRGAPADEPAAPALPAVEAPADLLCDVYVSSPNVTWGQLQRSIGGAIGILPSTFPGVLLALSDADAHLATEIDGRSPIYGALAGDPSAPAFALAMRLVDPARARELLTRGEGARYAAEDAGGVTALVPLRKSSAPPPVELAMTLNGYLVVAGSADDRDRLGAYLTRTLPLRPTPAESVVVEVPRAALKERIAPKLAELWAHGKAFLTAADAREQTERGRAPDYGDPAAIISALDAFVVRRTAIVGDLDGIRLALDVTDEATVVTATLTPRQGDSAARAWISGMPVGDASELLALPEGSAVAFSTRTGPAERDEEGGALEEAASAIFGSRLERPEVLRDVVAAATRARGEVFAAGVSGAPEASWFVRAPVRDESAAEEALRGLVTLARSAPLRDLLGVEGASSRAEEVPGVGSASLVTLTRGPKRERGAGDDPPKPLGLAWAFVGEGEGRRLALAAGAAPLPALQAGARPERSLSDEPALARFTRAIGGAATTVLVAQPLRLDPRAAERPASPLAIAIGRRGEHAFVHVDIAPGLLREAARRQLGF